jgi:hypothetical protein
MTKEEKIKVLDELFGKDEAKEELNTIIDYSAYHRIGIFSEENFNYLDILNLLTSTDYAVFSGFKSEKTYDDNTIENGKILKYLHNKKILSFVIRVEHNGINEDLLMFENDFDNDSSFINLLLDLKEECNIEYITFSLNSRLFWLDSNNGIHRVNSPDKSMDIYQLYAALNGYILNNFKIKGLKLPVNFQSRLILERYGIKYAVKSDYWKQSHKTKIISG